MGRKLTEKQKKFVDEYVSNGGNGTQAAMVAYDTTTPGSAQAIGSGTLLIPKVADAIESIQEQSRSLLHTTIARSGIINAAIARLHTIIDGNDPKLSMDAVKHLESLLTLVQRDQSVTNVDNRKVMLKFPK